MLAYPVRGALRVGGGNPRFPFFQHVVFAIERYGAQLGDLVMAGNETRELQIHHEEEHAASFRYRPSALYRAPTGPCRTRPVARELPPLGRCRQRLSPYLASRRISATSAAVLSAVPSPVGSDGGSLRRHRVMRRPRTLATILGVGLTLTLLACSQTPSAAKP